ncbi:hypothetical protein BS47DRAFT_1392227 [Hydnum rufescens UP504]|uniref:Uncharacterized protein n=1 Tax=Hydnum rufescens UP504 TaxID=1448309 RepID=A0A9P6B1U4_9AGAM|nr:hypothetical protein BS47DRAFT_1392227 [Hydnum rufescens UP504]
MPNNQDWLQMSTLLASLTSVIPVPPPSSPSPPLSFLSLASPSPPPSLLSPPSSQSSPSPSPSSFLSAPPIASTPAASSIPQGPVEEEDGVVSKVARWFYLYVQPVDEVEDHDHWFNDLEPYGLFGLCHRKARGNAAVHEL